MAVKKGSRRKESRRLHSPVRAGSKEAAEHAARLTPPEEQNGSQSRAVSKGDDGAILVDTSKLKLPKGMIKEEDNEPNWFGFDPVVLIILGLSVLFIAFIAYLISTQPAP
jgi:hypothetical protein